jgi:hypothetical protein
VDNLAKIVAVVLVLVVSYPDTYPDVIPDLQVESSDEDSGELDDDEEEKFLSDLRSTVSHDDCYGRLPRLRVPQLRH